MKFLDWTGLYTQALCLCFHPGDGQLTFPPRVHGEPRPPGVLPAALGQAGPGGAGAGHQAGRRLDEPWSIPDNRQPSRHPSEGYPFFSTDPPHHQSKRASFCSSSRSCRFSENTHGARRCLCNHGGPHGSDEPSVPGQ